MSTTHDPIAHAARLLREAAQELKHAHTIGGIAEWDGTEPEVQAVYDEHMAAAEAIEEWERAVGAGGVGPLRKRDCLHQIAEPSRECLQQSAALHLADACAGDWEAVRPHLVVQMLRDQHARIADLEAHLSAIGAGGVESLRKPSVAVSASPYATAEESASVMRAKPETPAEKLVNKMIEDRWLNEQGVAPEAYARGLFEISAELAEQLQAAQPSRECLQQSAEAEVLLRVIQRLNQNPYSLTKSECISEVSAMRDAALQAPAAVAVQGERRYWKMICAMPRYSFMLNDAGGVARVQDSTGNWIDRDAAWGIVDSAEDTIAELRAALASAPAQEHAAQLAGQAIDTERLDWLGADGSNCVFHLCNAWYTRASYGQPYRKRANLREAIDAAMAAQQEGGAK